MTRRSSLMWKIVLPTGVIALSLVAFFAFASTKPKPPRSQKAARAALVETITLLPSTEVVTLQAKGTVIAAQSIVLQSELAGRIVSQSDNLVPGGRLKKGEAIVRIDARDYEIAVERSMAEVNRAKLALQIEARQAEVAKKEWEAFGDSTASDAGRALALRQPQIESAKVDLRAAQGALKKSQLDLKRAVVRAPFNALVVSENVDVGQLVGPQSVIATLVGADEFWVQVSVPVSALERVRARTEDAPGSKATVVYRAGGQTVERIGEVIRQLPDLDPGGSMARLLVEIDQPLEGAGLPMLLGSFVEVAIDAGKLEDAFAVPRGAMRDGDKVYLRNKEGKLEIRRVEVAWQEPDHVLVSAGLSSGDELVTSRLSTPVPNMLLRVHGEPEVP